MRQTHLSEEIRTKGMHHSREVNRAHALSSLDPGIPESQIMAVLGLVERPCGAPVRCS